MIAFSSCQRVLIENITLSNSQMFLIAIIFFFSSRRRHTRYWRDWSSDVCSSDLRLAPCPLWTDCNRTIHQAEAYAIHEKDIRERPEDFSALTRNRLLPGAFVSSAKYIRAQQLRGALCREFAEAMHDLDAVVTLSSLLLPCRIDDPAAIAKTYDQQCRLVFNVTGTPA